MNAYKSELSQFFSTKKQEDNQFKRSISRKSFEEKKEFVKEYRASALLDKGVYSINANHRFERQYFIRDIDYLEKLKEEIRMKQLQFNKYKYDVLYDLVEMSEPIYDGLESEIIELKKKRDDYISKKSQKIDENVAFNEEIDFTTKQMIESFKGAELEDQKELYKNIILSKKKKFDRLEPKLSMLLIDDLHTLVTDYLPIKNNEKNLNIQLNAEVEEVKIEAEDLEPEPEVKPKRSFKSKPRP